MNLTRWCICRIIFVFRARQCASSSPAGSVDQLTSCHGEKCSDIPIIPCFREDGGIGGFGTAQVHGKSDRFKSIYAALYFFPILTVLQAVGGGLLYYAFPYIILVLSLITLAVYMSASEIQSFKNLIAKKKRLVVLFSHWLLHAYGIISISRLDKLEQDLPLLALVPGPALFYLLTAKFTEPNRILSEGGNGH